MVREEEEEEAAVRSLAWCVSAADISDFLVEIGVSRPVCPGTLFSHNNNNICNYLQFHAPFSVVP